MMRLLIWNDNIPRVDLLHQKWISFFECLGLNLTVATDWQAPRQLILGRQVASSTREKVGETSVFRACACNDCRNNHNKNVNTAKDWLTCSTRSLRRLVKSSSERFRACCSGLLSSCWLSLPGAVTVFKSLLFSRGPAASSAISWSPPLRRLARGSLDGFN